MNTTNWHNDPHHASHKMEAVTKSQNGGSHKMETVTEFGQSQNGGSHNVTKWRQSQNWGSHKMEAYQLTVLTVCCANNIILLICITFIYCCSTQLEASPI